MGKLCLMPALPGFDKTREPAAHPEVIETALN
jgi:hypothetical protein